MKFLFVEKEESNLEKFRLIVVLLNNKKLLSQNKIYVYHLHGKNHIEIKIREFYYDMFQIVDQICV
jgi:hypothetical protein